MKVYNLDKFLSEDKEIDIRGNKWTIAGDIDMHTWAELKKMEEEGSDDKLGIIHKVLNLRQKVDIEELGKVLTPSTYALITHIIFNDVDEKELDEMFNKMKLDEKKISEEIKNKQEEKK